MTLGQVSHRMVNGHWFEPVISADITRHRNFMPRHTNRLLVPRLVSSWHDYVKKTIVPTNSVSLHTARKIFVYLLTYLDAILITCGAASRRAEEKWPTTNMNLIYEQRIQAILLFLAIVNVCHEVFTTNENNIMEIPSCPLFLIVSQIPSWSSGFPAASTAKT